jgi:glutamate synthase (NADPH/NADH) small chain
MGWGAMAEKRKRVKHMNTFSRPGWQAKYAWREVDRVDPPKRSATNRVSDFRQTSTPYDEVTAREQAGRCIQCPNASCVTACPLGTPIVELLALTANGQFREAAELMFATNALPEVASHVCVGGRLCERVCLLASKSDPVPIRAITRFLLDYGWKQGLAEPAVEPLKGRSIAVIGSGIGGLVAADTLSRRGYSVTIFDSRRKPGGRVMNGLPGFRMDKEMVERRLELLRQRGVQFCMNVVCGRDLQLNDLRARFDAVYLGFGLADPVALDVPGANLRGVYQAYSFVSENVAGAAPERPLVDVRGRRVVVLGGGDTAMDALRTAIRCGASEVLCLYRRDEETMAADAEEYACAVEEGAQFLFHSQPLALVGNATGDVTAVHCRRTESGTPDVSGRCSVRTIPDTDFDVPAEVVLVAYGFAPKPLPRTGDFAQVAVDGCGRIVADANQATNLTGVFAGGSIVRGPVPLSIVVLDARKAAAAIDSYLAARRLA